MILKWLHFVIGGKRGSPETPLISPKLFDVAHEALAKDALEKKLALQDFEKYGALLMKRQRLQQKVKIKVKKFLSIPLSASEEEDVVEEVTERITEAAQVDSHLNRLFDKSEN